MVMFEKDVSFADCPIAAANASKHTIIFEFTPWNVDKPLRRRSSVVIFGKDVSFASCPIAAAHTSTII